jgi:phosphoserine aminotransferase
MTIYNFSAGPAVLPKAVLQQAQAELLDWHGSGMSVMEMSHRGKEYMAIHAQAEADLRELMGIPANYKVLFLQGGAHLQFAMIPLNLLRGKTSVDYVNTGEWSKKAIGEAKKFSAVNVVVNNSDKNNSYVPAFATWKCDPNAAYLHYTPNETIGGVEFNWIPETGDVPLVADMSSNILSRQIDVSKFGLIYAGAQKNIGPAGLTLVIVREDLLGQVVAGTPTMLDYKTHADNDSMYNTPPTYGIYMAGLVFAWLKQNGGIAAMEQANIAKANLLYGAIDASNGFYNCPVATADRSRMNVPFTLKDASLDGVFLKQADAKGLLQLKGHRSVGGMRASIYNAMPIEGVQALVNFMNEFAQQNG